MAYQALYRKYRPQTFDDFIDQDNTKRILINAIINDKISHAYLFSGPRGIGKTSMAKIFAKAINCSNFKEHNDVCNNCENCIDIQKQSVDIIEIDAASNNGVDQIRELKDNVSIVSNKLKYKVYIIDEVHMLTNSAFNALLKTLEEPPSHVVFILATTEFYEVPETIVSRCQCFSFSRISMKRLIARLQMIVEKENIDIDEETIEEIAHYSNGGLRDAIGMLDKLHSFTNDKITIDIFKSLNGMISQEEIENFYSSVMNKDCLNVLSMLDKVNDQGYDFKNFIERIMILVRDKIVNYYTKNEEILGNIDLNIEFVNVLNTILTLLKEALNPLVVSQIYLLKYMNVEKNNYNIMGNIQNDSTNISREMTKNDKIAPKMPLNEQKMHQKASEMIVNEKNKEIRINNALATASIKFKKNLTDKWEIIDNYFMDDKYGKISQLLSDSKPMVVGEEYSIFSVSTTGLLNKIYSNLNQAEEFVQFLFGKTMHIVVVLDEEFLKIKDKYIEDKKNNIVYQVQEECGTLVSDKNNLVSQAIGLFGSDIVEIE